MDNRLKDRICIITGGSSGLGRATALRYANSGARVVIADLQSTGVEADIQKQHGQDRATFVACDVTDEASIKHLVDEASSWGGRLDVIVNYAGIAMETRHQPVPRVDSFPTEDYDRTFAINARGVWLCCKYALQQMLKQEPREPNRRGDRTRGWM
jgi:NAD(P)-dependent dehydrogenase (short-subunit alcohol dehydrogenase family)